MNTTSTEHTSGEWTVAHRTAFRFLFLYWVLFNIPQQNSASFFDFLPWGADQINHFLAEPMQPLALWLGAHVFHLKGIGATFHPTGSGDTALDYILVLICFCLAIVGTIVWSALDRKRQQYRTLDAWLRLFLAITLAIALVEYGFAKIFPSQFGPISLSRLNETYGDSSPMALMWTFMGGSRWYTMFGGFAELLPGLLLFFRRTRTLGALLGGAVMLNVVLLNFCYDIPVKIYSSHLLLMAIFLVWPDLSALVRLFLFRQQAQLRTDHVPAPERIWIRRTGYIALGVVIACTLYTQGYRGYQPYPGPHDADVPLYGQWHVDHATSTTTMTPWDEITIDRAGSMLIRQNDGSYLRLNATVDLAQNKVAIKSKKFGESTLQLVLDPGNARHVTFSGPFNHGQVALDMHRRSPDSYTLLTRGFHWVNETSPNY